MTKLSFEETLIEVWRQALVENAEAVKVGGESYSVRRTPKLGLREVDFTFDGNEIRGLEQNPDKHGLIEKTLSIPDVYKVFLKVGADLEVEKLRRKVAHGNKMKHVPALYLATAMALQGMTKQELEALKLRIKN